MGAKRGGGVRAFFVRAFALLLALLISFALLAKQNFSGPSPEIRAELLEFLADPNAPYAIKSKKKEWARVQAEIAQLRQESLEPWPPTRANS